MDLSALDECSRSTPSARLEILGRLQQSEILESLVQTHPFELFSKLVDCLDESNIGVNVTCLSV